MIFEKFSRPDMYTPISRGDGGGKDTRELKVSPSNNVIVGLPGLHHKTLSHQPLLPTDL